MATVYLAEDLKHHRKVAVKVLRPDLAASLGPERFLREVTIAANLQHPHVLPLYDSGQADGFLYYAMPYVEGTSLRQKLLREGELPIPDAVRILRDIADAIAYAHRHGVVHRDIKPENVMLSDRHALVTDFGVAKAVSEATGRQTLTTAGVALGTPAYMAPEQAAADPQTDHRADIYAFGVVAYELLTGRPPFVAASPQAVVGAHMTMTPDPVGKYRPSIPPGLVALVMKCLEKKPADRWQSAEELLTQLEAVLTPSGGMSPAVMQPVPALAAPITAARRWPLLLGALAVVGVIAGGIWYRRTRPVPLVPGRVAVLPLENKTGDPALDDWGIRLAAAMTEAINREGAGEPVAAAAIQDLAVSGGSSSALTARVSERTGAELVVRGAFHSTEPGIEVQLELLRMPAAEPRFALSAAGGSASDSLREAVSERTLVALTLEKEWGPGVSWQGEQLPRSMRAVREYLRSTELEARQDTAWLAAASAAHAADPAWHYGLVQSLRADILRTGEKTGWVAARAAIADFEQRAELTRGDREAISAFRAWLNGDLEARYQAIKRLQARRPTEYTQELAVAAWASLRLEEAAGLRAALDEPGFWSVPARRRSGPCNRVGFALHLLGRYQEEADLGHHCRAMFPDRPVVGISHELRAAIGLGDTVTADRLVDELARVLPGGGGQFTVSRAAVAAEEYGGHGYPEKEVLMLKRAKSDLERILATGDTTSQHLYDLGRTLGDLGDLDLAERLVPGMVARGDSVAAFETAGAIAAQRGNHAGVASMDARLAGMRFENPYWQAELLEVRARLAAADGDDSRAIDLLQLARRSGSDFWDWHAIRPFRKLRQIPAFQELLRPRGP